LSHEVAAGYQIGTPEFSRHDKTPYGCADSLIGTCQARAAQYDQCTCGAFAQHFFFAMRGCLAPVSWPESRQRPQRSPGPSGPLEVSRSLRRKRLQVLSPQGQPGASPGGAGVGRGRPRRGTPARNSRLEFAATASPASTGGRAPGRALGAPPLQEAYFVAAASDSWWQFGRARKTSLRDRHAVRLSKLPDVAALALEWPSAARTVALLSRRG
jgi:hypothetical protein